MQLKIAIIGLFHESNTFCENTTTLENFREGHLLKGQAICEEYRQAFHEIGGMMEVLEEDGRVQIVPLLYAEAVPGGTVEAETYSFLFNDLHEIITNALPLNGCLVVPHGAAVCESFPDMDGHWLSAVRKIVGENTPIVGTLDPHANASQLMIEATNALIAYRTNPHVDQRETGKKAARLLLDILRSDIRVKQSLFQIPLAISIEKQNTGLEPCKSLLNYAQSLEKQDSIISVSVILGFPYADVSEMGTSVIVVSDADKDVTPSPGLLIKKYILDNSEKLIGTKQSIATAIDSLPLCQKPVLMLDMGDNIGGGAPGNSILLLKELEAQGHYTSFISVYDPLSVRKASEHDIGDTFTLTIGKSKLFPEGYTCRVTLLKITDGKFRELHPRHGGQVNFNMGATVVIETSNGNVVMLTSLRVPPFSLRQMTSFDIEPGDFDVIVAKGVNAPIAAYGPICAHIIQVDTPGVTRADITAFDYKNRRRPMFPFEPLLL